MVARDVGVGRRWVSLSLGTMGDPCGDGMFRVLTVSGSVSWL